MKIQFILFLFLAIVRIAASCTHTKQLEGILLDAIASEKNQPDAKLNFLELGIRYYSDNELQKVRLDENVDGTRITIIQDYEQHKSYTIVNGDKCITANLTQRFPDYPPKGAIKKLGSFEFGGSAKSILVDGYSFNFQGIPVELFFNPKNCIPVAETTYVRMLNQMSIAAITFSNMTTTIRDLSVFNVPSICSETAVAVVENFDPIHHARLRFTERHTN